MPQWALKETELHAAHTLADPLTAFPAKFRRQRQAQATHKGERTVCGLEQDVQSGGCARSTARQWIR